MTVGLFRRRCRRQLLSVIVSLGSGEPPPDWASFDPRFLIVDGYWRRMDFLDVLTIRAVASDSADAETANLYAFIPSSDRSAAVEPADAK